MKPMTHRRASGAQRGLSLVTTLIFMLAALALGPQRVERSPMRRRPHGAWFLSVTTSVTW